MLIVSAAESSNLVCRDATVPKVVPGYDGHPVFERDDLGVNDPFRCVAQQFSSPPADGRKQLAMVWISLKRCPRDHQAERARIGRDNRDHSAMLIIAPDVFKVAVTRPKGHRKAKANLSIPKVARVWTIALETARRHSSQETR
jgi:hypothetical protein